MEWTLYDTDDSIIISDADMISALSYARKGLKAMIVMIDFERKHLVIMRYKDEV